MGDRMHGKYYWSLIVDHISSIDRKCCYVAEATLRAPLQQNHVIQIN